MIRPLRRAHRTIFIVLAALLPTLIIVAIWGREALAP